MEDGVYVANIKPSGSADPLAPHSVSAAERKLLIGAERAGEAIIVFRGEDGAMCLSEAPASELARTIGRREDADLALPWDREVSGVHALLQRVGGEITIIDDGLSTNGTYVNGQRINGRHRLRHEDRVRVGRTILVYRDAVARTGEHTIAAGDRGDLFSLSDTQRRVLIALCRPFKDGVAFATPATNQEIAAEVFLGVDAVKVQLRALFVKFELGDLPQGQKRARLAEAALRLGVVNTRELG